MGLTKPDVVVGPDPDPQPDPEPEGATMIGGTSSSQGADIWAGGNASTIGTDSWIGEAA